MYMPSVMNRQPALDFGMFVGGIVIDHQMNVQFRRDLFVYVLEKAQVFLVSMLGLALSDHVAISDVQSRKQCSCSMAFIVMCNPLYIPQPHGKHGLGPFQGLDLALLIDTEHHGILRGTHVEADDISNFFHKKRIG